MDPDDEDHQHDDLGSALRLGGTDRPAELKGPEPETALGNTSPRARRERYERERDAQRRAEELALALLSVNFEQTVVRLARSLGLDAADGEDVSQQIQLWLLDKADSASGSMCLDKFGE